MIPSKPGRKETRTDSTTVLPKMVPSTTTTKVVVPTITALYQILYCPTMDELLVLKNPHQSQGSCSALAAAANLMQMASVPAV